MDANSGEPWSEMDVADLTNEIERGQTVAKTASFLCRDEDEVREKMKELGLVERPRKEKPRRSEGWVRNLRGHGEHQQTLGN
jgi:hypothetical protein